MPPKGVLSYKSYYASGLFEKIKKYINRPQESYRVGCLDIEPAILLYNGFYTIDGYIPNYPLEYKKKFYKVIGKALEESDYYKDIYVNWGSKCYLFDGDQPWLLYNPKAPITRLHLDFDAFYDLGGRYLVSSHRIESNVTKKLEFLQDFTDDFTFWHIYLYRVKPHDEKQQIK
jgi:hypothetical protein